MLRIRLTVAAAFIAAAAAAVAQSAQSTAAEPVRVQSTVAVTARPQSATTVRTASPRAAQSLVYGQGNTPYALTAANAFDTTKVSPDIDNMKVGDAVKKVLEAAGKEVEIDKEIPDVRVSVKAKDIRLGTFMDMMSQAAGAGWSIEMRDGKARYRFGKDIKAFGNWVIDPLTAKGYRSLATPQNGALFNRLSKGQSFVFTDPTTGASTFQNYLGAETRMSITCPHCKGNVTTIRTRTAPKCPKCSRTFQAGWEFCPADGTKRPVENTEWKHCPLCGKEVDFSKAEKKTTSLDFTTQPVITAVEAIAPILEKPAKR